jgi:signal transduction histidine kinase
MLIFSIVFPPPFFAPPSRARSFIATGPLPAPSVKKARSNDEKFQGVLEMAGGVAHSMSQPLTIINNYLSELLGDLAPGDPAHQKIVKVSQQIARMNDITKKIGNIRKYEAMDYVAGVRIVDIEKAS